MVIKRTPPRYPRQGPSCLLVLFVISGVLLGMFVIVNRDEVRDVIIPTPTPEPTRSATEYALLADLSEGDGEYQKAIEFYENAIRLDASKSEFFIRLIKLLVDTRQPERALEVAEQATVLAPQNDAVWTAAASAYITNGDRLLDLGDPTGADLQYAQAVQAAEKAIAINPQNATAYAYAAAGLVLPNDPNKFSRAQEMADIAIAVDPENATARYYMATVLDYQGYYEAARENYQLGLQYAPNSPNLYFGLAYNFFGTGNIPEAILSFEQAITADPEFAAAYDGLAYMYLQLGQDPLAEENALEAVRLNPNVARAHGRLGEAYFRQFNYPNAIESLERAVSLYGEATDLNARFFLMLGNAYIRDSLDNCAKATPLFEQVIAVSLAWREDAAVGIEECRRALPGS
ncbi:MAG: tetratricopeptide repeat protein [Chloroflexi bacterium]|nr:tetratricopeptide repeat protein [Chloroflexota bacterium]MBP6804679.1 tetratricopeptide repeat protein [Chloroflexota bacterium]